MNPAPPVTRYEDIFYRRLPDAQLSNGDATHTVVFGGACCPSERGSAFATLRPDMLVLIVLAILVCSLVAWLVLHLGIEVIQALIALAMMTITWNLLRRRPGGSIADEFRHW